MRNTVSSSVLAAIVGVLLCSKAFAGDGLQPRFDAGWESLQGRLVFGTAPSSGRPDTAYDGDMQQVSGLSLLGDYYLTRPLLGMGGGLRATSGVLLGQRSAVWSRPSAGSLFSMDRLAIDTAAPATTAPYFGVGYTGFSFNRLWGVSADLGLMAILPRSGVRLGRNTGANLDDSVRELRLSPILQLGVSYAF